MSRRTEPAAGFDVAVVIPARDEASRIAACLQALARQRGVDGVDVEVILVADGCRDDTIAVAHRAAARHRLALRTIVLPGVGVGGARRAGMELAMGEVGPCGQVFSTDADSRVAPDWIAVQRGLFREGAVAIGGDVLLDGAESQTLAAGTLTGRQDRLRSRVAGLAQNPRRHGAVLDHPHFAGSSLAVRGDILAAVGSLPDVFTLEDQALADRLEAHNIPIVRTGRATVTTSARLTSRAPSGLGAHLAAISRRA